MIVTVKGFKTRIPLQNVPIVDDYIHLCSACLEDYLQSNSVLFKL